MKRKGFTLIELLAVIVILAIIALIAVPTILNIINNAQKSAFKDSVYGIIKSGEVYYTDKMMNIEGMTEDKTFTFPNSIEGLEIKGSKPTNGTMIVTKEGKIGIAVSNGKYCIKKGYTNEELIVDENLNNCEIPSILTSQNTCVKDKNATCSNGTEVTVQVNKDISYNFYVIKDTGSELTLIMDRNIGDKVAWNVSGNNADGPMSALNYLEEQTLSWTNISTMSYMLSDDSEPSKYSSVSKTNIRARMLTYKEIDELIASNNGSIPNYLLSNLWESNANEQPYGYWLSSTVLVPDTLNNAKMVFYIGFVYYNKIDDNRNCGVRPVITVLKKY